jgi:hypothetical protein
MTREQAPEILGDEDSAKRQRDEWLGGEALVRWPRARRGLTPSALACLTVAMAFAFGAGLILGSAATTLLRRSAKRLMKGDLTVKPSPRLPGRGRG